MKKEVNLAFLAMTVFISIAIICEAQPPDSIPELSLPSSLPGELMATQPAYIPPVSTGEVITSFEDGQAITSQDIVSTFGYGPQVDQAQAVQAGTYPYPIEQIKLWAYYNHLWTQSPTSINFNGKMDTVFYTNQREKIWVYEYYPDGHIIKHDWGYRGPGYVYFKFIGDTAGWHQIFIYGENSRRSNVLQIYVQHPTDFAWECFKSCWSSQNPNLDVKWALDGCFDICANIKDAAALGPIAYATACSACDACVSTYIGYKIGYALICADECYKNRCRWVCT